MCAHLECGGLTPPFVTSKETTIVAEAEAKTNYMLDSSALSLHAFTNGKSNKN
jgi:hypothetical protein